MTTMIIGYISAAIAALFVIWLLVLGKMGKLITDLPDASQEEGQSALYEPSQEEINQLGDNLYTLSVQGERAFASRSIQDVISVAFLRIPHARLDEQMYIFRNDPHTKQQLACICTIIKEAEDFQVLVELAATQVELAVISARTKEHMNEVKERQTNVQ